MEYRVEELAGRAGVAVDTIRYYQARGLLEAPRREGRIAWYGEGHLRRLRRVRELAGQGFSLAQVARLLAGKRRPGKGDLTQALVQEQAAGRTFSRTELARESGIPEALLAAAERAGLLRPVQAFAQQRFTETDLAMARVGLALLGAGLPAPALLALAQRHARGVDETVERAIDLFEQYVQKGQGAAQQNPGSVTERFRELLPQVSRLIALHFERTLIARALARSESPDTQAALARAFSVDGAAPQNDVADSGDAASQPDGGEPQTEGAAPQADVVSDSSHAAAAPSAASQPGGASQADGDAPQQADAAVSGDTASQTDAVVSDSSRAAAAPSTASQSGGASQPDGATPQQADAAVSDSSRAAAAPSTASQTVGAPQYGASNRPRAARANAAAENRNTRSARKTRGAANTQSARGARRTRKTRGAAKTGSAAVPRKPRNKPPRRRR